jgi:hypothetical protein
MVCLRNISVNTLHEGGGDDELIAVIIGASGTISKL